MSTGIGGTRGYSDFCRNAGPCVQFWPQSLGPYRYTQHALGRRVCRPHVLTEPIGTEPMIELFSFFEEREAGPLVLSDDIAVWKGIDGAGARGGSEVVKGHGGTAA